MNDLSGQPKPVLLSIGMDRSLSETSLPLFRTVEVDSVDDALRQFCEQEISVLILGPRLAPVAGQDILARCISQFPATSTAIIVMCAGPDPTLYRKYLDERRIFYLSKSQVTDCHLRSLLVSAASRFGSRGKSETEPLASSTADIARVLDFCARLSMQSDLPSAGKLLAQAVRELLAVDSVRCLLYDPDDNTLTPTDGGEYNQVLSNASTGIAGFVVRTQEMVCLNRAGSDSCFNCDIDNPGGGEDARFIAMPITTYSRPVAGVIIAVRNGQSAPFSTNDRHVLELLAECAAPGFSKIRWQNCLQAVLAKQTNTTSPIDMFLGEEQGYPFQDNDQEGDALQTLPAWLTRSQWVLALLVLVGLFAGILGKVDEYARGPVVIKARDKIGIATKVSGRVTSVEVLTGDHVKEGDPLVRLEGTEGHATSNGNMVQVPATENGTVCEIFVHSGQLTNQGDLVVSIVREQAGYNLVAFLPGAYAQQLQPGMPLGVNFHGNPGFRGVMQIDSVSSELAPREAVQHAELDDFDGSLVAGPVVIVRSRLPFVGRNGEPASNSYRDGMTGEAEVRVYSAPIITSVFPSLKKVFGVGK